MERWRRIQALMEAKRRGMEAHERYLNQTRSYAPGEELYMREMHFLMAVGPSQSPTMSEIAKWLEVTHGAVSQIAARLEKKGLIRREKAPGDRRQTVVMLTEYGQALYQQHLEYDKRQYQVIGSQLAEFSDEQLDFLIRDENLLGDMFQQVTQNPKKWAP